jgi:polysaccharide deacetylase 2 family uncharacterized protein YibQ
MSDRAVPGDELNDPLGIEEHRQRRRDIPYAKIAFAGVGLLAATLTAFVLTTDERRSGGEPIAISRIDLEKQNAPALALPSAPTAAIAATEVTGSIAPKKPSGNSDIEARSGVKVIRPGGARAPGALVIDVSDALAVHLSPAPDKRLVEKGRYGLLPKIGADGSRPSAIYSRPLITEANVRPGAPRIAIVIGGLGLSSTTTNQAIAELPAAVSLAFAPYGDDLPAQVARARDVGHEVLLQLPMETFDYPTNNPGPHTLLTALEPAQNLDHLAWLMSRFTGYVGVTNFLGGKFLANEAVFGPVLREIGNRGLIFFDDGTSPRSLASGLGANFAVAGTKADVVIDATTRSEAIEAALNKLEAVAREKNLAVGSANALPITVEHVARFARALAARGIALVPVSAASQWVGQRSAEGLH